MELCKQGIWVFRHLTRLSLWTVNVCVVLLHSGTTYGADEPLLAPDTTPQSSDSSGASLPSRRGPLNLDLSDGKRIRLPDPEYARSFAQRIVAGIGSLAQTLRRNAETLQELGNRVKAYDDKLTALRQQKMSALEDMRRGAFCRACHRARTQVEASGEAWQHHLDVNSGGVPIAATQKELDDKAREFDQQIASVEADKAKNVPLISQAIIKKQQENEVAAIQMNEGMKAWRLAVSLEQSIIEARDLAAEQRDRDLIKEAKTYLARIEARFTEFPSKLNPEQQAAIESQRRFWQQVIDQTELAGIPRSKARWDAISGIRRIQEDDYRKIIQSMRGIDAQRIVSPTAAAIIERIPLTMDRYRRRSVWTNPEQIRRFSTKSESNSNSENSLPVP